MFAFLYGLRMFIPMGGGSGDSTAEVHNRTLETFNKSVTMKSVTDDPDVFTAAFHQEFTTKLTSQEFETLATRNRSVEKITVAADLVPSGVSRNISNGPNEEFSTWSTINPTKNEHDAVAADIAANDDDDDLDQNDYDDRTDEKFCNILSEESLDDFWVRVADFAMLFLCPMIVMSILYAIIVSRLWCVKVSCLVHFLSSAVAELIAIALVPVCPFVYVCVCVWVCVLATDLLDNY